MILTLVEQQLGKNLDRFKLKLPELLTLEKMTPLSS